MLLAMAGCALEEPGAPAASITPAAAVPQQPPVMPTRRPAPKPVTLSPAPATAAAVPAPAPLTSPAPVEDRLAATAPPPPAAAPPAPSRVRPRSAPPGINLSLRTPSLLPKVPGTVTLAIEAKLSNDGNLDALLSVPTACDVVAWEIVDRANQVLLSKEPAICAQVVAESTLRPGEILVARDRIEVPGDSLTAGGRYRLRYAFWGAVAEADIAVQ
ncbi:hypothetical protein [Oleomonas cavernae]|uniref:hypothetical protein n=1 Tax=Oleomonas cavernae TaxID=2320859 RepID=UPI0011C38FC9|nr:hypothetical protein [Oleomonas cavernae]